MTEGTAVIRIVIADDHALLRDGLLALIDSQSDLRVVGQASDGDEAIEQYALQRPDLLITDLRMRRLDGVEVIKRLIAADPAARILVVTTFDNDEDIYRCFTAGAKGYLLKDSPRDVILQGIRSVARGEHYTPVHVASKVTQRLSFEELTVREIEVLGHAARGVSNKEIARLLDVAEGTVKTHIHAVLKKLNAMSRTEAVAIAVRRGIVKL
jgi:two-component system, NarL family, response regulator